VVIEPNGRVRTIEIYNDATPVHDPADPVRPEPPPPPRPNPGGRGDRGGDDRGGDETSSDDRSGGPSASGLPPLPSDPGPPSGVPLRPPTNVAAEANTTGQVTVTWSPSGTPTAFRVLRADTGAEVANVAGTINLATV